MGDPICLALASALVAAVATTVDGQTSKPDPERAYLRWSSAQAQTIGGSMRVNGRVGGALDLRIVHNKEGRVAWPVPESVRLRSLDNKH